jgi:hypothetical protein
LLYFGLLLYISVTTCKSKVMEVSLQLNLKKIKDEIIRSNKSGE